MEDIGYPDPLVQSSRLPGLTNSNVRQAASFSFPISWIPALLLIVLILTFTWSLSVLRPRWIELTHSNLNHQAIQAPNESDDPILENSKRFDPTRVTLSPAFTPEVREWTSEIAAWSRSYDLHPNLVAVVMQIESCGYRDARSSAGAMGLFQVMPFHFEENENPYDPDTNAHRGLSYLSRALELADGRVDLALAGYNGGHSVIFKDASEWSEETRRYVSWGVNILHEIEQGTKPSFTLEIWLNAGGARLCTKAAQAHSAGDT